LSDVATLPLEIQKKSFSAVLFVHTSDYLRYLRRKSVIHLPTQPENVTTLTFEMQNFFYLTERLLCSFEHRRLQTEPVVGCHRWLCIEPVVMCDDVWQLECQASNVTASVKVTTFCINTCFHSFSAPTFLTFFFKMPKSDFLRI